MKFWDSSALLPLLVWEPSTSSLQSVLASDPAMIAWWGSRIECESALARLERERTLTQRAAAEAASRLTTLEAALHELQPGEAVRRLAGRFLRLHALSTAHAVQLAAAFVAAGEEPRLLEIVSLDDRLRLAALREGFEVVPH